MYRTLTRSSDTIEHHLGVGSRDGDRVEEEVDANVELVGHALERPMRLLLAAGPAAGVRKAPMDLPLGTRELGADLAHAVTESDHVVERLARELAQMLGAQAADGQAATAHDAKRVRMQGLGSAARADRANRSPGEPLRQDLRDLRPRAVACAEEQHVERLGSARPSRARAFARNQAGMERPSRLDQQLAAALEFQGVVGVAPIR